MAGSTEITCTARVRNEPETTSSAFHREPSSFLSPSTRIRVAHIEFGERARLGIAELHRIGCVTAKINFIGGFDHDRLGGDGIDFDGDFVLRGIDGGNGSRNTAFEPLFAVAFLPFGDIGFRHDDQARRGDGLGLFGHGAARQYTVASTYFGGRDFGGLFEVQIGADAQEIRLGVGGYGVDCTSLGL